MKQRVVFLYYHGFGHIIAVLKLARILSDANVEVYFAGAEYFQRYILSLGFKFYLLKTLPFGYGFEKWMNKVKNRKHLYFSTVVDRITDRLYHEREAELYWMLEELKPNTVLIDSRQATDFIILYGQLKKRNVKVAIVHPMLPLQLLPGRPPLNSDVFPHDQLGIKNAIRSKKWGQFKKKAKRKIIFLGFDDLFIIRRRLKKNQIPPKFIVANPVLINFALREIDEFIVAPKEFDFPDVIPEPGQHFIGFMTLEMRKDIQDQNFEAVFHNILDRKENMKAKLIYCSFGTIAPKEQTVMFSLLKKLGEIVAEENYILVVSLKGQSQELAAMYENKNVYFFDSVPQLQVLQRSDLFVTHGGMNSVKEAVQAEVPMLLYPIHPEFDPNGNAARVAYHGLGLRGQASVDTATDIAAKVKELLVNPMFKKNVKALKEIDAQYTADSFMAKFHAIRPLA